MTNYGMRLNSQLNVLSALCLSIFILAACFGCTQYQTALVPTPVACPKPIIPPTNTLMIKALDPNAGASEIIKAITIDLKRTLRDNEAMRKQLKIYLN